MLASLIAACGGNPERHSYVSEYLSILDEAGLGGVEPNRLPEGPRRFFEFLDGFSAEAVERDALEVYAENAYLNDTLKTVRGGEAIREYFLETFRNVAELDAQVVEVTGADRSWYFRWQMTMRFEDLNRGRPATSVGVSHVVFDDDGRVLVHQDYWDAASHFFVMVPIAGQVINKVKNRL